MTVDSSSAATPTTRKGMAMRPLLRLAAPVALALVLALLMVGGVLSYLWALPAIVLVVSPVGWLLRAHLGSMLLVFLGALLAASLLTRPLPPLRAGHAELDSGQQLASQWAGSGTFNEDLPIVLHLIFDEMMSPGAMTNDLPGSGDAREGLRTLARSHALRMFEAVYSRHFYSAESLPHMMNPAYLGQMNRADAIMEQQRDLSRNRYLEDYSGRGYRTAVFQPSLIDFCASPAVDLCQTFNSFDPGQPGQGLDRRNRTAALWRTVARAHAPSFVSEIALTVLDRVLGLHDRQLGVLGVADRYDVQRFPAWFDRFAAFAAGAPRGSHIVAHFMVPHSPYLLTAGCMISGQYDAGYYLSTRYPESTRAAKRREYYAAYFEQLRCLQHKLDELLERLSRSEQYRDAVIIIHGDHGSRISSGNTLEEYSESDYVDNYATFFAVKAPGVAPGIDCDFLSLGRAFRRYAAVNAGAESDEARLPVFVTSREAGQKVEAAMPVFGCAADEP